MKPEEKARQEIDKLINLAGWEVQDYNEFNLGAFSWSRLDLIQFINSEFPSRFISQRSPLIPNRLIPPIREGICLSPSVQNAYELQKDGSFPKKFTKKKENLA
jgi:hypothetical protein